MQQYQLQKSDELLRAAASIADTQGDQKAWEQWQKEAETFNAELKDSNFKLQEFLGQWKSGEAAKYPLVSAIDIPAVRQQAMTATQARRIINPSVASSDIRR